MPGFILNDQWVETTLPPGSTVLDFVRYHQRLPGTKIGCREGDCGACTVLVGALENNEMTYRSMTSCLMPLGNASGKHIVTVEGINMKKLSPVQQLMVDCNGTQCGFCTPGFIISLTGFVLGSRNNPADVIAAMDGNICRCTGYKSIERAAGMLTAKLSRKPATDQLTWLVGEGFIPEYFAGIPERLRSLHQAAPSPSGQSDLLIGGGTDLIVQKHAQVKRSSLDLALDDPALQGISLFNGRCRIGAAVTVTQFVQSPVLNALLPGLPAYIKLVSSTPIRNMATLAGNLVNASPIGDMTVFLLGLDASVLLNNGGSRREIKLNGFYLDYKKLDKQPGERMEAILFDPPEKNSRFNFEKVSKRTHLDIASVNSACLVKTGTDGRIEDIHLSAGGVAPYPKYLTLTREYLIGKMPVKEIMEKALAIMQTEVAPISDARGTKEYKRLLLRQLFLAHMMKQNLAAKAVKQILIS